MRNLKRGQPEDQLAPGESLQIRKGGRGRQKVFELRRTDQVHGMRNAILHEIDREIPPIGKPGSVDLQRMIEEDGL